MIQVVEKVMVLVGISWEIKFCKKEQSFWMRCLISLFKFCPAAILHSFDIYLFQTSQTETSQAMKVFGFTK